MSEIEDGLNALKKLLDKMEGVAEYRDLSTRHDLLVDLCRSWGLTPADSIRLLIKVTIGMAVSSKKDDSDFESVFAMLDKMWARDLSAARRAVGAYEAIKEAVQPKPKPESKPDAGVH